MMNVNLAFSGQLGSGKTTVSRLLAERIGARWNSFGNTVKRIARERGITVERGALQALGADLVSNSPEAFCQRVIREAEPPSRGGLVLDGLRHAAILKHLQQILLPSPVVLVFVDVDEAVRLVRMKQRGGAIIEDLRRLESHSTEVEVMAALRGSADLRADNSGAATTTVEQIVTWLLAKGLLETPRKA
jgi:cytidylate kinase